MTMTITEVLKGLKIGEIQTDGVMQIIPLIQEPDLCDDNFVPPSDANVSTANYGTLVFDNPHKASAANPKGNIIIIPFGAGYIVAQAAQNHATPMTKMVKAGKKVTMTNAACIQENQGGRIHSGKHPMTIIPWAIKEAAISSKDNSDYSKLWPAITEFNLELGLNNRGHLELFLEKFKEDLNQFIAAFEPVYNQVGAIILIEGKVVGVERAPNYAYWASVWKPLIRECYGSRALTVAKKKANLKPPETRVPLANTANIRSIKDIRKALTDAQKTEDAIVKSIVRKFISRDFNVYQEEKSGDYVVESVKHQEFSGQIVRDDEQVVYASLVTLGKWLHSKKTRAYAEADEFEI